MSRTVFISYQSHDEKLASALSDALSEVAITNWFAKKEISSGEYYAENITPAIEGCSLFLLIASKYSVGSKKENLAGSTEVKKELKVAMDNKRVIIPLKIDNALEEGCSASNIYHLGTLQWFDVSRDEIEVQIERSVNEIKKTLAKANSPSQGIISELATSEQENNIKQIEKALKNSDTFIAQKVILSNKFAKEYNHQLMLLKIITSMIKNDIKSLPSVSIDKLLSQLNTLSYSDYAHFALYLKSMLSISYFRTNGVYDKTGGFNLLFKEAKGLPSVPAKYILMSRHIKNVENVELKWKHFL